MTGDASERAVVFLDGGSRADAEGTWSASLEWLVARLAPDFPDLGLVEVRYRIKSWNRLKMCMEDAAAAIDAVTQAGARELALVGYSLGGAVALGVASRAEVTTVVGLAPWLPKRLPLTPLRGRRLAIVHGSLDRQLPGIPGVSPSLSRDAYERARALGVDATYTLVRGALHGIAVREPLAGSALPLPRARRWRALLAAELERFRSG